MYRPSKNHVLRYDTDRLSFIVIVGVLMMRNRSTMHFTSLLVDTLNTDYGIPCSQLEATKSDLTATELDMLRAAASKLPDVPFEDVEAALSMVEAGVSSGLDKRVVQAATHYLDYMKNRYKVASNLDGARRAHLYAVVTKSSAQDTYHKALRFVAVCENTLQQNHANLASSLQRVMDDGDPNIVLFKRRVHAYHMKIVLGHDYLVRLGVDMDALGRHEKVYAPEELCLRAYTELLDASDDAEYVRKLFDVKAPTGLMVAKWILGSAFGLEVCRRDRKQERRNYRVIAIHETHLRDMQATFGARVRKPGFLFRGRAAPYDPFEGVPSPTIPLGGVPSPTIPLGGVPPPTTPCQADPT